MFLNYINIYCHPLRDYFLSSQLFNAMETLQTLHQTDILSIDPLSVSEGILRTYLFTYTLISYWGDQFMRIALHSCVCGSRQFPT